jgi:hypothetical protein
MTQRSALRAVLVAACTATTLAESAAYADEREQCKAAAEQAQQLRDEGKYRRAREQMLFCARDVCPGPIKSDCGGWLSELDRLAPTVVFGARSSDKDVVDVKVSMDGTALVERLDGKPIVVDSGEHTFKFEHQGNVKEERVLIRAAEKARPIVVTFASAAPTPPPPPPPPPPRGGATDGTLIPPIVVGGIGVLALGSFAFFAIQGTSDVSDLEDSCKPNCPKDDVDRARTKLIIADISLGVGVVALAVSAYLFFTRPTAQAGAAQTGSRAQRLRLDAGPVAGGGGVAGASVAF